MSDMKASVTLELIEKGFEKADKAAKSLDKLAASGKKAGNSRRGNVWGDDRMARNAERAARAEAKHTQAIFRSSEAMRRQKNDAIALERQQRRLEQAQRSAALKAEQAARRQRTAGFGSGAMMSAAGSKLGGVGMAFLGGMGIGVGAGAGMLAAETVKGASADEWERDQLRVLGNISEAQMKIHRKALDLAAVRRGVGTQGSYGVFGGLMAGGLSDADAAAMTDSVIIFAKATKASTEDAARSTVALRNNMGINAESMISAYDAIALGGKAGQFEVEDMASSLPSLLAKMSKLGETGETGVRNTVAMAQAIRKTVGSSDEAATNFENMLDKFTSTDFVENAGKIGINVEQTMKDAQKKGLSPAFAVLQKIAKATKGDPFKISKLVPDRQAAAAIAAVLGDMDFVLKLIGDMENSGGTVMNDYAVATDNASDAWDRFAANVSTKAKGLAEVVLPAVTAAMNKMSEGMELSSLSEAEIEKKLIEQGTSPERIEGWKTGNRQAKRMRLFSERLFGLEPSEATRDLRTADAYTEYGQTRAQSDADIASAEEVERVRRLRLQSGQVTDLAGNPLDFDRPRPRNIPEPTSRRRDEPLASNGIPIPTPRPQVPIPTPRPDIEKAMQDSGRKAEAVAKSTAGSIESILAGMDTYAAGLKAGNQFAAGLRASAPDAAAAANAVASSVAGHFPQSPAKVGPLRKLPSMGRKISAQLAGGMDRNAPARAASRVASGIMKESGAAASGNQAAGSGGARSLTLNLGGMTINGVSDPRAAADHAGDAIRRKLDGVLGDVGLG
jgi:TP901 family phage tail tape measure protein